MEKISDFDILQKRNNLVVKSNNLIQKSRFSLSTQEQKIILFLVSKIKPEDVELKTHRISVKELCDICGIELNGKNYLNFKNSIKSLSDKSFWIDTNETSTLIRWIEKAKIHKYDNTIEIGLNEELKPYLIQLKENFTNYELTNILTMKSKYSIRLYELLKSYSHLRSEIEYGLEELKSLLQTAKYSDYKNFRVNVLEIAINEINEVSDIFVSYEPIREKRKIVSIRFTIDNKIDTVDRLRMWSKQEGRYGRK